MYSLLFGIFLLSMIVGTGLYLTRHTWTAYLPERVQDALYSIPQYTRLPSNGGNFLNDVESGFHSNNFNLGENINEGDSRTGLDARAKQEVHRIMKTRGVGFDEARSIWTKQSFKKAGIGDDGLPNDPKLVTFGSR